MLGKNFSDVEQALACNGGFSLRLRVNLGRALKHPLQAKETAEKP